MKSLLAIFACATVLLMGCAKEEFDVLVPIEAVGAVSGNGNQQQLQLEECPCAELGNFRVYKGEDTDPFIPTPTLVEVFNVIFEVFQAETVNTPSAYLIELFLADMTPVPTGNAGNSQTDECGGSTMAGWYIPTSLVQGDCVKVITRVTWYIDGFGGTVCKVVQLDGYFSDDEFFLDPDLLPEGCLENADVEFGNQDNPDPNDPCVDEDGLPIFCL